MKYAKIKKKNSGITLMELIIALAIIAIIAGIVALNLFGTTDRARLRSDVQSTLVLRSATEMYSLGTGRSMGNSAEELLENLYKHGYLHYVPNTQTEDAKWVIQNGRIYLNIPSDIDIDFLNYNEKSVILGQGQ